MLPSVVALWIAIRILVEFVFPFLPFPKSQRHQLAEISVLYTFLEEIRQALFAWHSHKKSHDAQFLPDKIKQTKICIFQSVIKNFPAAKKPKSLSALRPAPSTATPKHAILPACRCATRIDQT